MLTTEWQHLRALLAGCNTFFIDSVLNKCIIYAGNSAFGELVPSRLLQLCTGHRFGGIFELNCTIFLFLFLLFFISQRNYLSFFLYNCTDFLLFCHLQTEIKLKRYVPLLLLYNLFKYLLSIAFYSNLLCD
jgi:hypothetical protein